MSYHDIKLKHVIIISFRFSKEIRHHYHFKKDDITIVVVTLSLTMYEELSVWYTLLYTLIILSLMFLLSKLLAEPPPALRIRDNKNGHKWSFTGFVINFPLHCNACETFLMASQGQCCTVCGVAACSTAKCVRTVDRRVSCKSVSKARNLDEARAKISQIPKHKYSTYLYRSSVNGDI